MNTRWIKENRLLHSKEPVLYPHGTLTSRSYR
jgi:hypothetical protein